MKKSVIVLLPVVLILMLLAFNACENEPEDFPQEPTPDYRLKYTGTYYCTGNGHSWNEAVPYSNYFNDTVNMVVTIDTTSINMLNIDGDLFPIDENGYCDIGSWGSDRYRVEFHSEDSINYNYSSGGNGGGYWVAYKGVRID